LRRVRSATLAVLALLVSAGAPARAYFDDVTVNARSVAMGLSSLAATSDVAAYYWNPAGLGELGGAELLLDYGKPYGVPDLNSDAVAVGLRAYGTGFAVAWHRLGIANAYAEDLYHLAAGRSFLLPAAGHRLAGGATLKVGRISFEPFGDPETGRSVNYGDQTRLSLDLGLRWTTPWKVDFAWVGRDLLRPNYEFIEGTGGGSVPLRHQVAAAYRWNRESTLTAGWSQVDARGRTNFDLGLEIWFYDVFAIRSGFTNAAKIYEATGSPTDFQFTGGFGIRDRGWNIDAAALTNRYLGASYRVSFRTGWPFGGRK